jgi:hypothetical protein
MMAKMCISLLRTERTQEIEMSGSRLLFAASAKE